MAEKRLLSPQDYSDYSRAKLHKYNSLSKEIVDKKSLSDRSLPDIFFENSVQNSNPQNCGNSLKSVKKKFTEKDATCHQVHIHNRRYTAQPDNEQAKRQFNSNAPYVETNFYPEEFRNHLINHPRAKYIKKGKITNVSQLRSKSYMPQQAYDKNLMEMMQFHKNKGISLNSLEEGFGCDKDKIFSYEIEPDMTKSVAPLSDDVINSLVAHSAENKRILQNLSQSNETTENLYKFSQKCDDNVGAHNLVQIQQSITLDVANKRAQITEPKLRKNENAASVNVSLTSESTHTERSDFLGVDGGLSSPFSWSLGADPAVRNKIAAQIVPLDLSMARSATGVNVLYSQVSQRIGKRHVSNTHHRSRQPQMGFNDLTVPTDSFNSRRCSRGQKSRNFGLQPNISLVPRHRPLIVPEFPHNMSAICPPAARYMTPYSDLIRSLTPNGAPSYINCRPTANTMGQSRIFSANELNNNNFNNPFQNNPGKYAVSPLYTNMLPENFWYFQ